MNTTTRKLPEINKYKKIEYSINAFWKDTASYGNVFSATMYSEEATEAAIKNVKKSLVDQMKKEVEASGESMDKFVFRFTEEIIEYNTEAREDLDFSM